MSAARTALAAAILDRRQKRVLVVDGMKATLSAQLVVFENPDFTLVEYDAYTTQKSDTQTKITDLVAAQLARLNAVTAVYQLLALPSAPTSVTASISAGSTSASLSWTAPSSLGDGSLLGYTITISPGRATVTTETTATSATVTGLTVGITYTFTVMGRNARGLGVESEASNSITPST
jgi:hypothetical protein